MHTILIWACRNGNVELAHTLLERGASPHLTFNERSTFERIFIDLKEHPAEFLDCNGKAFEILELFLNFGYDPNTIYGKYKHISALRLVLSANRFDLADKLIESGANVNLEHGCGTLLYKFSRNCDENVVKYLLTNGVKVFPDGILCLFSESETTSSKMRIMEIIFDHVLKYETDNLFEIFQKIILSKNYDFLKKMLEKYPGIINMKNKYGSTVFMYLCQQNYFASLNTKPSVNGHTGYCVKYRGEKCYCNCDYEKYISMIQFMLDNGVDINQTNDVGISAYGYIYRENIKLKIYLTEYITGEKIEGKYFGVMDAFKMFAKHGKLQQIKDILRKDGHYPSSVKSVFEGEATPEVKDFLLKWSKAQDELYGKSKYSLVE